MYTINTHVIMQKLSDIKHAEIELKTLHMHQIKLCFSIFSVFISGYSSQPIWLDSVHCSSSYDKCLSSCQTCPLYENHNCNHNEDVSLECRKYITSACYFIYQFLLLFYRILFIFFKWSIC